MINGKTQFQGKISKDAIENTFRAMQNAVLLRHGYKDHHTDNNINSKSVTFDKHSTNSTEYLRNHPPKVNAILNDNSINTLNEVCEYSEQD